MIYLGFSTRTLNLVFMLTTACLIHSSIEVSLPPADHLVPPPLPAQQHLPPPGTLGNPNVLQAVNPDEVGFMTRIAHWFGFGSDAVPREQQLTAASEINPQFATLQGQQPYNYPKPNEQQNGKAFCNLCNKYPWIPMLPNSIQYPPPQQSMQWGQLETQESQLRPQKQPPANYLPFGAAQKQLKQQPHYFQQRETHTNFPNKNNFQPHNFVHRGSKESKAPFAAGIFIPIPVPNLSPTAIPPLYNAQPFRNIHTTNRPFTTQQQLPSTAPAHFHESLRQHSELQHNSVYPSHTPATSAGTEASFEIIRSHQIADFVSSIEYPATYVQSTTIDVGLETIPPNHKLKPGSIDPLQYQHQYLDSNLNNHIPGSQLLTNPSSFGSSPPTDWESTSSTQISDETTTHPSVQVEQPTQMYYGQLATDSFPSASYHNHTTIEDNQSADIWLYQTNELYYTSTESPLRTETHVETSHYTQPERITEKLQATTVELVPSLQSASNYLQQFIEDHSKFMQKQRDRGTPKRLLDSPIQHAPGNGGSSRIYTRDPSELNFKLSTASLETKHPHHTYVDDRHTTRPWLVTPASSLTVSTTAATPTATHSAIDASPPFTASSTTAVATQSKDVSEIVIPYTTRSSPRPFDLTPSAETTTKSPILWSDAETHDQQESRLVSSATAVPAGTRRTTKYLTKILASNLRELLKREQDLKNKSNYIGFDLHKLQKNIDDWTEQEYTSLSHRPSTPTIRGRSKHIPADYLTTVAPPTRYTKLIAELSTSVNNLEPLQADRSSKRLHYVLPNDDNRIFIENKLKTSSSINMPSSTTAAPQISPYYTRTAPNETPTELWHKARVSISPQTKEKVYVVTPQPRFFPQSFLATSTETPPINALRPNPKNLKSPRFLVRPTPGKSTSAEFSYREFVSAPSSTYSSRAFGLMGLSAYVPAEPVEIIDGNSKVVTITSTEVDTKSSEHSEIKRIRLKPTMSPAPR